MFAPEPIGLAYSGGFVFVDESAEQVAAVQAVCRVRWRRFTAIRWKRVERAVQPVLLYTNSSVSFKVQPTATVKLSVFRRQPPGASALGSGCKSG
jgi:hypothetical protein